MRKTPPTYLDGNDKIAALHRLDIRSDIGHYSDSLCARDGREGGWLIRRRRGRAADDSEIDGIDPCGEPVDDELISRGGGGAVDHMVREHGRRGGPLLLDLVRCR